MRTHAVLHHNMLGEAFGWHPDGAIEGPFIDEQNLESDFEFKNDHDPWGPYYDPENCGTVCGNIPGAKRKPPEEEECEPFPDPPRPQTMAGIENRPVVVALRELLAAKSPSWKRLEDEIPRDERFDTKPLAGSPTFMHATDIENGTDPTNPENEMLSFLFVQVCHSVRAPSPASR